MWNGPRHCFDLYHVCIFVEQTPKLQSHLQNFLRGLDTCSGYLKHSSRSGEHSALRIRTVRHVVHIIFKKTWFFSIFGKIHVKTASSFLWFSSLKPSFERTPKLQSHLEIFLRKLETCSGYLKHSPRSGEHSALWIRPVRHQKHFIFKKVLTPPFSPQFGPRFFKC